jgi:hypothetical protein
LGSYFYVENDDRTAGIQVYKSNHGAALGMRIDIVGSLYTLATGERLIVASSVLSTGTGSVEPLGMTNRALGGADWFYNPSTGAGQRGVAGAYGPNNIGLLVRTTGRVVAPITTTSFYLDDGSGVLLKVTAPSGSVPSGSYVVVTGISSCSTGTSGLDRVLKVSQASDIDPQL